MQHETTDKSLARGALAAICERVLGVETANTLRLPQAVRMTIERMFVVGLDRYPPDERTLLRWAALRFGASPGYIDVAAPVPTWQERNVEIERLSDELRRYHDEHANVEAYDALKDRY